MKIAIAEWENRVAPVFDCCRNIIIFEGEPQRLVQSDKLILPKCLHEKSKCLYDAAIQLLICGAISRSAYDDVENNRIEIIPFISGEISAVVDAWQCGTLESVLFSMPGRICRKRRRRCNGNIQNNLKF